MRRPRTRRAWDGLADDLAPRAQGARHASSTPAARVIGDSDVAAGRASPASRTTRRPEVAAALAGKPSRRALQHHGPRRDFMYVAAPMPLPGGTTRRRAARRCRSTEVRRGDPAPARMLVGALLGRAARRRRRPCQRGGAVLSRACAADRRGAPDGAGDLETRLRPGGQRRDGRARASRSTTMAGSLATTVTSLRTRARPAGPDPRIDAGGGAGARPRRAACCWSTRRCARRCGSRRRRRARRARADPQRRAAAILERARREAAPRSPARSRRRASSRAGCWSTPRRCRPSTASARGCWRCSSTSPRSAGSRRCARTSSPTSRTSCARRSPPSAPRSRPCA